MRGGHCRNETRERAHPWLALVVGVVALASAAAGCATVRVAEPADPPRGGGAVAAEASPALSSTGEASSSGGRSSTDEGSSTAEGASGGVSDLADEPAGPVAPPGPSSAPPPAVGASADSAAPAAKKLVRAKLEVGEPVFTAGEVPKARASLAKLASKVEACVDENGGLTSGETAALELQFLVGSRGIAEGVDVRKARGIGPEAARCVRDLLQRRGVGTPSVDPVGVTVTLGFRPAD